jgi:hypothetical protein
MRKILLAALFAVVVVGVGAAGSATATPNADVVLRATLTGIYLRTTSIGSGTATITVKPTMVRWNLAYKGLDQGGDSGIHIVPPRAPGRHKTSVFPLPRLPRPLPDVTARRTGAPEALAGWARSLQTVALLRHRCDQEMPTGSHRWRI